MGLHGLEEKINTNFKHEIHELGKLFMILVNIFGDLNLITFATVEALQRFSSFGRNLNTSLS